MSVEEIIRDLRNEVESIYGQREHLSDELFVFCSHVGRELSIA